MQNIYINVIIDISVSSLDRIFQYRVPENLAPMVRLGRQVIVPFGKGDRRMKGFIVGISDSCDYDEARIKEIIGIEEDAPAVTAHLIELADWMRMRYGTTTATALKTVLPVRRSVKEVQRIEYVLGDRELATGLLNKSRSNKRDKARVRLLEALLREGSLPAETVSGVLRISDSTIKTILKTNAMKKEAVQIYRDPLKPISGRWDGKVRLNHQQKKVVEDICEATKTAHLIHGITGSGKTEVYMALIESVLARGEQVIVLIPEISLTLQTVSRFYEHFGNRIAVLNSKLSAGERYDQYMRARRGDADIMIGPRSAVFAPFERLGMIIIDEEHELSYKSENAPRYHAREVAIKRAELTGAKVILGSATPDVISYTHAVNGDYGLHRLTMRAKAGSVLPEVEIVDLREEFRMANKGIFSGKLHAALRDCIDRGEQAMLFINRRGYAGFVSCRSCGHVIKCKHCDVSLTFHQRKQPGLGRLKCHYCGWDEPMPRICPECGSPYIAAFGLGTQKVEDMVRTEFPDARILRMDKDTTSGKDDMEKLIGTFADGGADILIGTQMIVKGHDFDKVTLVGIIAADLSMFSGDYMSAERTFQLLTQAAGRAGRSQRPGKVIIQTYQPDNYCITAAAAQDYEDFYRQEITFRQMMQYPPGIALMQVFVEGVEDEATLKLITDIKERASVSFCDVLFIGPSPAPVSKARDMYRFVLYMKHRDSKRLRELRAFFEDQLKKSGFEGRIYMNFDIV